MIVIMKMEAKQAFNTFKSYQPFLHPYRDASRGPCQYECTILHCLEGLEWAIKLGWYDFKTFNAREYEHYEKVENGDLNWIIQLTCEDLYRNYEENALHGLLFQLDRIYSFRALN